LKLSVCMATFNGEKYIARQLQSILCQLNAEDEVIISDDTSNDSTLKIIKNIGDKRVVLLENNMFRNPTFNFENALKHSTGDIIFLSDQDDEWKPNKVEITIELLKKYDMVVCDCELIDHDGNIIMDSFYKVNNSGKGLLKNFYKNTYLGCCMAFNRKLLNKALPFPEKIPMHDIWLGMIASIFGDTCFTHHNLMYYRRHGNNSSTASGRSNNNLLNKIKFRYNLIVSLFASFTQRK